MTKRNRQKHAIPFDQRLQKAAEEARAAAGKLPQSLEREALIERARQAETAARINEWLTSPGSQSPK